MMELRFFEAGTIPEYSTQQWHAPRDRAPHLEQEAHRGRLFMARDLVLQAAADIPFCTVTDFGCGDGGLLSLLAEKGLYCHGYDFTPANVAGASERGVHVELRDFTDGEPLAWGDVAVVTEVLEHMADPHGFLRLAYDNRVTAVVASSPADETDHNHVEYHVWAWDMAGYAEMVTAAGFRVVRHERVNQFQVLLAVADHGSNPLPEMIGEHYASATA